MGIGPGAWCRPTAGLELTDLESANRVVAISTQPQGFQAEPAEAGKKVVGGAALGAGIGGMIDGGEGHKEDGRCASALPPPC